MTTNTGNGYGLPSPLNAQTVFDKAALHLLRQGRTSTAIIHGYVGLKADCAYRGRGGTACAVGCLIPDEHYLDSFEGTGVAALVGGCALMRFSESDKIPELAPFVILLAALQNLHDGFARVCAGSCADVVIDRGDLVAGLRVIAARFRLSDTVLDRADTIEAIRTFATETTTTVPTPAIGADADLVPA